MLVGVVLTNKIKVIVESQPVRALDKRTDSVPASVKERPFQSKGSSFSQIVIVSHAKRIGFTEIFKVTIESQPVTSLTKFTLGVPKPLDMVIPFHSKGKAFEHTTIFSITLSVGLT